MSRGLGDYLFPLWRRAALGGRPFLFVYFFVLVITGLDAYWDR